jgi:hypothetical protein
MAPGLGRVDSSVGALRTAVADATVRRLLVAWLSVNAGQWALLVTTLVVAYAAGGAVGVGIIGLARYLAPTLLAPFVGLPAARWPPEVVLGGTNAIRTVAVIAIAAMVAADAPFTIVLVAVAVEAGAGAFSRPLHMAMLPAVATTPQQLIAANVTSGAAEGLGTFLGPAVASVLLVATGPIGALLAIVAIYASGVVSIARLRLAHVGRRTPSGDTALTEMFAGFHAAIGLAGPRLVIACLSVQTFVRGLLNVLIVVAAIELLGLGEPGVGTLNAIVGLGGLLGAIAAISLAGRDRLGPAFAVSLAGWGAPIAIIGLFANPAVAMAAMVGVGVSNAVLDVTGYTLAQRLTPNTARVALLGLIDSAANAGPALGGLLAPALVAWLGISGALIVAGAILPITAILAWPSLQRLDERSPAAARRVDLLRGQPLFVPLSLATIEHLASLLGQVRAEEGTWLMREGDVGDRYLLIDEGEADVLQGGQVIGTIGPGGGIGEIALLHDVPRTASVRATTPIAAFSLDRSAFLEAVTGHPVSRAAAETVASQRLTSDRERDD